MPRKSGADFMMDFVREYLDGKMDRMGFDLYFNHFLIKHFPAMERRDRDFAECFYFYLAEQGFDCSKGLSNSEHKNLISEQWDEFSSAMRDGFC
jgi:hypothetical protein